MLDIKFKKFLPFIFIILVGIIPLFDLFHSGLPLTHDGQDHAARIANFYTSLSEGILIPRWAGNLNWGFGHPILMFLYPLPSYFASLFHFLGFSLINSLKIVFGLTFIASGIAMFLWVRKLLGELGGIFAAILYMFAPYRFVNLYVRGAIGEHVSFMFVPLVLFFITKLFLDKKHSPFNKYLISAGVSLSTAGLILSHNALSILFLSFTFFYALVISIYKKDKKNLILSFAGIIFGFLLSAFFWLPAFIEGKYTLRDIVTGGGEYSGRFVEPFRLFMPEWSYGITGQLSVQIGLVHLILIVISIYAVIKLTKKDLLIKRIYVLGFSFFLISLFMMIKESDFIWRTVTTLQKFQFPWRFLSLTVLTSSFIAAYAVLIFRRKEKIIFGMAVLLLSIIVFYGGYFRAKDYLVKDDSFFERVYYGTTDTGESGPIWSVRFMEKEADSSIEVISGKAIVQEVFRSSTRHEYTISAETKTRIKENTLYFPGWNVYVDGRKLDVNSEIEFQDPKNRGLITFHVDKGAHNIKLLFEDTKFRIFSNYLSLLSLVVLVLLGFYFYKKNEYYKK